MENIIEAIEKGFSAPFLLIPMAMRSHIRIGGIILIGTLVGVILGSIIHDLTIFLVIIGECWIGISAVVFMVFIGKPEPGIPMDIPSPREWVEFDLLVCLNCIMLVMLAMSTKFLIR